MRFCGNVANVRNRYDDPSFGDGSDRRMRYVAATIKQFDTVTDRGTQHRGEMVRFVTIDLTIASVQRRQETAPVPAVSGNHGAVLMAPHT